MPKHLCSKSHGITPVYIRKSRSQKKPSCTLLGQSYHSFCHTITLTLVCRRGSKVNSSHTGMSFKLLVHKFRALVTQDPCDLRTMKGLILPTSGNPVNQGKYFSGNNAADLFSIGTKNGIKMPVLSCSTLRAAAMKYRFSSKLQSPQYPVSR